MPDLVLPQDYGSLVKIIGDQYSIAIDQIHLHRDWIGYVYIAVAGPKKYVLKLYRSFDSDNALRSTQILQYLKNNGYPVVSIVPTVVGDLHIMLDTPQGPSAAIVFEYVEGAEPNLESEITPIGRQVGWLHRLMKEYPGALIRRGKDFYIDRYFEVLRQKQVDAQKIDDLARYGSELWSRMQPIPGGFCHGDLHTGNMLQAEPGRYVVFDFDVASHAYPIIDVATLCDGTHFFHLDEAGYDQTLRIFERFYQGYSQECTLSDGEIGAMFDFIAIRHYELIPTITRCQGLDDVSGAYLLEQYAWLMGWKELCERKAGRRL